MAGLIKAATKQSGPTLKKAKESTVDPAAPTGAVVPSQAAEVQPVKTPSNLVVVKAPANNVIANPQNPRRQYHKLPELAQALATKGQLQPIKGVEVAAYLAIFPEDQHRVPKGTTHVANLGNRRLKAVQLSADLDTIEMIVDNAIAASRLTWRTSATSENTDREQLTIMDLAIAYKEQAQEYNREHGSGGQKYVSEMYGISEPTVSNWVSLPDLIPELQDLLDHPDAKRLIGLTTAFKVAKLDVDEQRKGASLILDLPVDDQYKAWKSFVNGTKKPSPPAASKRAKAKAHPDGSASDDENKDPAPESGDAADQTLSGAKSGAAPRALAAMSVDEVVTELAEQFAAPDLAKIGTMLLERVTDPAGDE